MKIQTVLLAVAAAWATAASAQEPPKPRYTIKEDAPRTGSMIRRNAVESEALPVNVSYEQLSPEHRAKLHALYESIAPGDEPPFPVGSLGAVYDPLRKAQAKLLVRGDLFVAARVDAEGTVREVQVFRSPDPEMTKFAAQVLLLTPFKPAKCGGMPCTMDFPLWMSFTVTR